MTCYGNPSPSYEYQGRQSSNKEEKSLGSVYIPYVKGVSEKFKCIGDFYNIRMIFKTTHTLRISLMETWPERDLQEMAKCIYSIPIECSRSFFAKEADC
jgi:hypothetical protein